MGLVGLALGVANPPLRAIGVVEATNCPWGWLRPPQTHPQGSKKIYIYYIFIFLFIFKILNNILLFLNG
jgi:hypothetical protein